MNEQKPRIIRSNSSLFSQYHELSRGDIVTGRVSLRSTEEYILLDLVERGVQIIPSALSQLISRSKSLQSQCFSTYMVPLTRAIHDQHTLLDTISLYNKNSVTKVVTKLDRKNAGIGINIWTSIEEVYNQASFNNIPYPFVVQPYLADCRDIRVIMLGDYLEAYQRSNPDNFRNNLHCGGCSKPSEISTGQLEICREAMSRGRFPYAHIDLMVSPTDETYLAEINLRGGLRGAEISPEEYGAKVEEIHQSMQESLLSK